MCCDCEAMDYDGESLNFMTGRGIAQLVSRLPLNPVTRVQIQVGA